MSITKASVLLVVAVVAVISSEVGDGRRPRAAGYPMHRLADISTYISPPIRMDLVRLIPEGRSARTLYYAACDV